MKKVEFTETILRDANQSLIATRLPYEKFAPMLAEKAPQARRVRRGAIVRVRSTAKDGWEIAQLPEVQAALLAIDSQSGAVRVDNRIRVGE